MANGNLPTDTPYDAAASTSTGRVLSEDAGREMAVQTRSNFAAGIGISGLQIQLKNGQSSPAIIGTATIPTASQSAAGAMTSADKAKLDGVAAGANNYVRLRWQGDARRREDDQRRDERVRVHPAPIIDGVPYYKDTNTTYADATQSARGLMTAADKKKLDGVAAGANNYSHPTTPGNKHIPAGGAAGQILAWASDGTAQWQAEKDTTYGDFKGATASAAGSRGLVPAPAMGAATRYLRSDGTWQVPPCPTIDSAISSTSANPVQNKAVSAELGKKAPLASPQLTGFADRPDAGGGQQQHAARDHGLRPERRQRRRHQRSSLPGRGEQLHGGHQDGLQARLVLVRAHRRGVRRAAVRERRHDYRQQGEGRLRL